MTVAPIRQPMRRWDDQPWTRGEQRDHERQWQEWLVEHDRRDTEWRRAIMDELGAVKSRVTWGQALVAILVVLVDLWSRVGFRIP